MQTTLMHPTRHDLPEETRIQVSETLNTTLATLFDFYSQAKQAHWNVKGMSFYSLHELFDSIAGYTNEAIDTVAERITALGAEANGTMRQAYEHSRLTEYDLSARSGEQHVKALAGQMATVAKHVRQCIDQCTDWGDADTADLYTELSREFDKKLWFLEAHLQG